MQDLKKAEKELIESIKSSDNLIVSDALQKIRQSGTCRILPDILQVLKDTENREIEAKIVEVLFDLKSQECAPILIANLKDKEMKEYHNFLVATFWQSSLDGSEYLTDFVQAAIEGDYLVCLECLTVVENFENTFNEEEIIECNADLEEAIPEEENQDKKTLLVHLKEVINKLAFEEN